MTEAGIPVPSIVRVDHWSSERPLRALVWVAALVVWLVLAVSVIGLVYVVILGMFFFVANVLFITHLRGNAVRLSLQQMPDLYQRVAGLSARIGLREVPAAYVLQAGGTLNALATKFLRSNFIVLYSDLLEACGDNIDARDFIIAHELGHLHAGHLRLRWLLLPGLIVPFLGTAYSRACEYTCDRYGLAAATDNEGALDGLCILAAGGRYGPSLNRRALVAQRLDLNTVWMKIGHWLSTHPPIAHRLVALQPSLSTGGAGGFPSAAGAMLVLAAIVVLPIAAIVVIAPRISPQIQAELEDRQEAVDVSSASNDARSRATEAILSLADVADAYRADTNTPPADVEQLYQLWSSRHPRESVPLDPYDGKTFGYHVENGEYIIWSSGPDQDDSSDDLYYSSQAAREE